MAESILVAIGDCQVFSGAVAVGPTFGGVKVKEKLEKKSVKVDGVGITGEVITGREISIEFVLTETDADQTISVMPGTTKDVAGNVVIGNPSGTDLPKKEITLKPIIGGLPTDDVAKHVIFHRCTVSGVMDMEFGDKQKGWKVDVVCTFDSEKGAFGQIGNSPVI